MIIITLSALIWTLAPAWTRSWTISKNPFPAALCKGVHLKVMLGHHIIIWWSSNCHTIIIILYYQWLSLYCHIIIWWNFLQTKFYLYTHCAKEGTSKEMEMNKIVFWNFWEICRVWQNEVTPMIKTGLQPLKYLWSFWKWGYPHDSNWVLQLVTDLKMRRLPPCIPAIWMGPAFQEPAMRFLDDHH